jgi:hypothetical protein
MLGAFDSVRRSLASDPECQSSNHIFTDSIVIFVQEFATFS